MQWDQCNSSLQNRFIIHLHFLLLGAMTTVIHIEVRRPPPGSSRYHSLSHFQTLITSYFEVGSPVGIRRNIRYVTLATFKIAVIIVE
jgi:hypothetical protein